MKILLALLLTIGGVTAAEKSIDGAVQDTRPKLTKAQHLAEAERFEARADEFAKKAAKHEEAAERIQARKGYNAMQHKWPGLANGPLNLARDKAMQARRAETESRAMAAYHRERAAAL